MLIAIDYDGTLTAGERDFWRYVIGVALTHGYELVTVTSREETDGNRAEIGRVMQYLSHQSWPIVFAHDQPKRLAAERAGFLPDIWIDDQPHMIGDDRGVLECQGVFENELRHAARILKRFFAGDVPASALSELSTRLQTVVGS